MSVLRKFVISYFIAEKIINDKIMIKYFFCCVHADLIGKNAAEIIGTILFISQIDKLIWPYIKAFTYFL